MASLAVAMVVAMEKKYDFLMAKNDFDNYGSEIGNKGEKINSLP